MDAEYEIHITESAHKDLESIYFYFFERLLEDEMATEITSELKDKILSLSIMPSRYSLVNDFSLAKMGYRRVNVKNYIVLYLIDEKTKTVIIARVIHERMNYAKFLF